MSEFSAYRKYSNMHWNICGSDNILGKYSSETLATMIFICIFAISNTVRLVQLVEHQIVVLGVVGSSPTSHPLKEDRSLSVFFSFYPSLSLTRSLNLSK